MKIIHRCSVTTKSIDGKIESRTVVRTKKPIRTHGRLMEIENAISRDKNKIMIITSIEQLV